MDLKVLSKKGPTIVSYWKMLLLILMLTYTTFAFKRF